MPGVMLVNDILGDEKNMVYLLPDIWVTYSICGFG